APNSKLQIPSSKSIGPWSLDLGAWSFCQGLDVFLQLRVDAEARLLRGLDGLLGLFLPLRHHVDDGEVVVGLAVLRIGGGRRFPLFLGGGQLAVAEVGAAEREQHEGRRMKFGPIVDALRL